LPQSYCQQYVSTFALAWLIRAKENLMPYFDELQAQEVCSELEFPEIKSGRRRCTNKVNFGFRFSSAGPGSDSDTSENMNMPSIPSAKRILSTVI